MRYAKTVASVAMVAASLTIGYAQQPAPPAQQPPAPPEQQQQPDPTPPEDLPRPSTTDPRANLKPGVKDAGVAAWNMELVANLPKPEGFFNPDEPPGFVRPPQPEGTPRPPQNPNALSFTNSDLAFSGSHVIVGNYHGFNTYNIERANRPQLIASVVCPGGQGDVSIFGNLLFMSVERSEEHT